MADTVSTRWRPTKNPEQNIEWCVKQPPQQLSFLGTSFEVTEAALTKVFGPFPIQLKRTDHQAVLAAMAAIGGTPYAQLLDALQTHGEIEVRQA